MDVLGENEALRQFFEGQDVRGVLESEVVDTSILEQFLSYDMDPSTFMLPESPPDSGSEPCSPPQIPDAPYNSSCSAAQASTGPSCCLGDRGPGPPTCLAPPPCLAPQQRISVLESACPAPLTPPGLRSPCHPQYLSPACQSIQAHTAPARPGLHHSQNLRSGGPANGFIQANTPPTAPELQHSQNLRSGGPANGYIQANTPPTALELLHSQNLQCVGPANSYTLANTPPTPPNLHHCQNLQRVGPAHGYIQANTPPTPPNLHHSQNLPCVGPSNGYTQANRPPTPPKLHCSQNLQCVGPANGYTQANRPPTPPNLHHCQNLPCVGPANSYTQANTPPTPPNLHHCQNLPCVGPSNSYSQANRPPTPPNLHHSQNLQRVGPANGYAQANAHPAPPVGAPPGPPLCMNPASSYMKASPPTAPPGLQRVSPGHLEPGYLRPALNQLQTGPVPPDAKKRRRSESFEGMVDPHLWPDPSCVRGPLMPPECVGAVGDITNCDSDGQGGTAGQGTYQLLAWEGYQPNQWSPLYDGGYQNLPSPGYHVDTDKGFSYSCTDEAFVCQKKNHFQVTVHIVMAGTPKYVKTPSGPKPIESFYVKVFGVKFEAQSHQVTIEQSQSDRTKRPFLPVQVSLPGDKVTKVTLGRLHFSETTANNMRKKGKPNPDQRYFMLVVGLYASVEEQNFLLVAHVSEKIIVRASNPGQFENDSEPLWQRGQALDTVVCQGRVGINTDAPDEALVVCGNAKIMGTVMHPSDMRAKQNIQEVDSTEQLKRIAQMRIVEYDYRPGFAERMGIDQVHETGVIAQEVKELLPSAVKEVGEITCADGETIDNFLMVDKEQIFMENVGAVKQLCKLTDSLQTRIQELEVWNTRLAKLKSVTGSLRSGVHRKASRNDSAPLPKKPAPLPASKEYQSKKHSNCLQHRVFQASVIMLVVTMGISVMSITGLYMLNLNGNSDSPLPNGNNSILEEPTTTSWPTIGSSSAVTPTLSPGPWPPDVDFCNLLYCEEVYCCPPGSGNHSIPATTPAPRPPTNNSQTDYTKEQLFEILLSARDWTNTTVQSIVIKENQHVIDEKYCVPGNCGSGNYSYVVPISKFVPLNMRLTVQMNTTELLVVLRCRAEESTDCSTVMGYTDDSDFTMSNTQGYVHEWPLPVAQLYQSSYHFRTTVAGKADCNTDPNFSGVLFTDYHFHFYHRCD